MKKILFSASMFSAIALTSCGGGEDAKNAAKDICKCMEPMMELTEKAEKAQENPSEMNASEILSELSKLQGEAMDCVKGVSEEYKDKISKDEMISAVKEECPKTGELMFPDN